MQIHIVYIALIMNVVLCASKSWRTDLLAALAAAAAAAPSITAGTTSEPAAFESCKSC
jgi:hypothetical protein